MAENTGIGTHLSTSDKEIAGQPVATTKGIVVSSDILAVFEEAYSKGSTEIAFKDQWAIESENHYREDILTHSLPYGSMNSMVDHLGRRLLVIGSRYGNIVVFERFPQHDMKDPNKELFYVQTDYRLMIAYLGFSGLALTKSELASIVGDYSCVPNIGGRIELLTKISVEMETKHCSFFSAFANHHIRQC